MTEVPRTFAARPSRRLLGRGRAGDNPRGRLAGGLFALRGLKGLALLRLRHFSLSQGFDGVLLGDLSRFALGGQRLLGAEPLLLGPLSLGLGDTQGFFGALSLDLSFLAGLLGERPLLLRLPADLGFRSPGLLARILRQEARRERTEKGQSREQSRDEQA